MAIIKTEPGQAKTVAVLLIILVIAGVATIVRIHPATSQPTSATAVGVSAEVTANTQQPTPFQSASQPVRNPFKRPGAIPSTFSKDGRTGDSPGTAASVTQTSAGRSTSFGVEPASVGQLPPAAGQDNSTSAAGPPKPRFELLATVRGPRGLSAVIRCDGTKTRIVGVGDLLGGYRVQKLESSRAYLERLDDKPIVNKPALPRKGSDHVIVVKRPQS